MEAILPRRCYFYCCAVIALCAVSFWAGSRLSQPQSPVASDTPERASPADAEADQSDNNNPTITAFIASPPRGAVSFRVIAALADYYNFQYSDARATHYSIQLSDSQGRRLSGYAGRTSEVGKRLYSLLSDGYAHRITVEVVCTGPSDDPSLVEITRFVSEGW